MAERVLLVCDVCGEPATQSVTFKLDSRSLAQDLCPAHVQELVGRSHAPRRGRPPAAATATPARPGRRSRPKAGRSVKSAGPASRTRRRVTDPAVTQKRRAALAKAREVLARKRAAAKRAT